MNRFQQVKEILDNSVGGASAVVAGPHAAFWRTLTRDQFIAFKVLGLPIIAVGNGSGSNIVKAMRGEAPFGQDIGTPGASIRRMPAGRDPVPPDQIAFISAWIDAGCPEEGESRARRPSVDHRYGREPEKPMAGLGVAGRRDFDPRPSAWQSRRRGDADWLDIPANSTFDRGDAGVV